MMATKGTSRLATLLCRIFGHKWERVGHGWRRDVATNALIGYVSYACWRCYAVEERLKAL